MKVKHLIYMYNGPKIILQYGGKGFPVKELYQDITMDSVKRQTKIQYWSKLPQDK